MSDLRRLRDETDSSLVRSMLQAARDERPADAVVERTLVAFGAGGAVLTSTATVSGAAAGAGATTTVAGMASGSSALVLAAKWIGVGAIGGLVAAGAVMGIDRRADTKAMRPSPSALAPARPGAAPEAPASQPVDEPALVDDEASQAAPVNPPAIATPTSEARAPAAAGASALAAEVALVDRARVALSAGHPERALDLVAAHASEFPSGRLAPEAAYLRMEALGAVGQREAARDAARTIVARYPRGPHAARAREVIGEP
jgi:hypothetical protein